MENTDQIIRFLSLLILLIVILIVLIILFRVHQKNKKVKNWIIQKEKYREVVYKAISHYILRTRIINFLYSTEAQKYYLRYGKKDFIARFSREIEFLTVGFIIENDTKINQLTEKYYNEFKSRD